MVDFTFFVQIMTLIFLVAIVLGIRVLIKYLKSKQVMNRDLEVKLDRIVESVERVEQNLNK